MDGQIRRLLRIFWPERASKTWWPCAGRRAGVAAGTEAETVVIETVVVIGAGPRHFMFSLFTSYACVVVFVLRTEVRVESCG